ncbi:hypothetical protein CRENBAI_006614 [Crenichthys baileyi]|uniref:Uncharacterized protein n=1 Tax=Crenichthys baileyi TaxID=28760 RepID=A0AAV9QSD3_9TELE
MSPSLDKKRSMEKLKLGESIANVVPLGNPLIDNRHDYASTSDSLPLPIAEDMDDFPPLPLSLCNSPAPKKPIHAVSGSGNMDVIASLSKLINDKADRLTLQIEGLKKTVDFACQEIKEMKGKVHVLETKVTKGEDRLDTCQKRIDYLESHSRRMNLRLYGVKEMDGEDVRDTATKICLAVLHKRKSRLGRKTLNSEKPRGIIFKISLRVIKEELWNASKTSCCLIENRFKFALDLTQVDKE